jgi:hypothetical protein
MTELDPIRTLGCSENRLGEGVFFSLDQRLCKL